MKTEQINLYYAETEEELERLLKLVNETLEVRALPITKGEKVIGFLDRAWIQGSFVRGEYTLTSDALKDLEAEMFAPFKVSVRHKTDTTININKGAKNE